MSEQPSASAAYESIAKSGKTEVLIGKVLRLRKDICSHGRVRDVVGCLPEGGVAEGWECLDCDYHTW